MKLSVFLAGLVTSIALSIPLQDAGAQRKDVLIQHDLYRLPSNSVLPRTPTRGSHNTDHDNGGAHSDAHNSDNDSNSDSDVDDGDARPGNPREPKKPKTSKDGRDYHDDVTAQDQTQTEQLLDSDVTYPSGMKLELDHMAEPGEHGFYENVDEKRVYMFLGNGLMRQGENARYIGIAYLGREVNFEFKVQPSSSDNSNRKEAISGIPTISRTARDEKPYNKARIPRQFPPSTVFRVSRMESNKEGSLFAAVAGRARKRGWSVVRVDNRDKATAHKIGEQYKEGGAAVPLAGLSKVPGYKDPEYLIHGTWAGINGADHPIGSLLPADANNRTPRERIIYNMNTRKFWDPKKTGEDKWLDLVADYADFYNQQSDAEDDDIDSTSDMSDIEERSLLTGFRQLGITKRQGLDQIEKEQQSKDPKITAKAEIEDHIHAMYVLQSLATDAIWPSLEWLMRQSNHSLVWMAAYSIYAELTFQPVSVMTPFQFGMVAWDPLEEKEEADGATNDDMTFWYQFEDECTWLYQTAYNNATAALQGQNNLQDLLLKTAMRLDPVDQILLPKELTEPNLDETYGMEYFLQNDDGVDMKAVYDAIGEEEYEKSWGWLRDIALANAHNGTANGTANDTASLPVQPVDN